MSARESSRLVLAGRLFLLLLALGAVLFAFSATREAPRGDAGAYTCPMHPGVVAGSPGRCPICGMALEAVSFHRPPSDASADLTISLAPDAPEVPRHDVSLVKRQHLVRRIRGVAWVDSPGIVVAQFYAEEVAALEPEDRSLFVPADGSCDPVELRLTNAVRIGGGAVLRLPFHVVGRTEARRPMQVGWVDLGERVLDVLVVPSDAILESPQGPYVMMASADGRTFTKRPVQIGPIVAGLAVVQSGVDEGERVVAMHVFSLDAERRLHAAAKAASLAVEP